MPDLDIEQIKLLAKEYEWEIQKIVEVMEDPTLSIFAKTIAVSQAESNLLDKFGYQTKKTPKDIQRDIQNYRSGLNSVKAATDEDVIDIKDFLTSDTDEDLGDWLVLNTIGLGALMYIGAGAKVGKTDLLYNLMHSVATGVDWLGNPVNSGNVVLFSLEEGKSSIKTKARNHGYYAPMFLKDCPSTIHIIKELDLHNNPTRIREAILEYKPRLVVIDTLRAALKNSPYDDNQQLRWEVLRTIQSYALKFNVTILAVHHFNKLDNHNEPLSKLLAGHSVLSGIGEGAIGLFRDKDGRSILKFETRDAGTKKLLLKRKRDRKTRKIQIDVMEIMGLPADVLALRKRILFQLLCKPYTYEALEKLLNNPPSFETAIESLEDDLTISSRILDDTEEAEFYISPQVRKYLIQSPAYKDVATCSKIAEELLLCEDKASVLEVYNTHGMEIVNKTMALLPESVALEFKIRLGKSIEDPTPYLEAHPGSTIVKVELRKEHKPIWHLELPDKSIIKCADVEL